METTDVTEAGNTAASSGKLASAPWLRLPARLKVTQAVLKTITYKAANGSVGFVVTYAIVQSVKTAATLSGIWLAAGPFVYFAHESTWNYFGRSESETPDHLPPPVTIPLPWRKPGGTERAGVTVSRAAAKTLAWRCIATVADFSLVSAVVGSAATAAAVSGAGVVFGSAIYFVHERAWDRFNARHTATPAMTVASEDTVPALLPDKGWRERNAERVQRIRRFAPRTARALAARSRMAMAAG
jgi:uncharacterized membrane protein